MQLVERHKVCTTCLTSKPIGQFHRDSRSRGEAPKRAGMGVQACCKVCRAERRKPGISAQREVKAALSARGMKRCGTCKRELPLGHFDIRRASTDGRAYRCSDCNKANNRQWREENPDGFRRWHDANRQHRSDYFRNWRKQNLEVRAASVAEWSKANRDRRNATVAKRNAAKYCASVAWADQDSIRAIYAEAARLTDATGIRHEVDHIYPLQGDTVCGLHCEANLQILTKEENIRKKNRMPEITDLPTSASCTNQGVPVVKVAVTSLEKQARFRLFPRQM